ncbi:MAG: arsenate reductase ArsC [Bacteroidales bacterium]|nr:arsenate reductase ArsC [Bacteroidales bacterium]
MKILILCTGNSCRSQMAEGFLQSFDQNLEVYSAGTYPSTKVHPIAVKVMQEVGIDLSGNYPKDVDEFIGNQLDYVVTVCGHAKENCPVFTGEVANNLHIGFYDPAEATGTEDEVSKVFRNVRDKINIDFRNFYEKNIKNN